MGSSSVDGTSTAWSLQREVKMGFGRMEISSGAALPPMGMSCVKAGAAGLSPMGRSNSKTGATAGVAPPAVRMSGSTKWAARSSCGMSGSTTSATAGVVSPAVRMSDSTTSGALGEAGAAVWGAVAGCGALRPFGLCFVWTGVAELAGVVGVAGVSVGSSVGLSSSLMES